ncbi:hypothetical protein DEU56DRAFT_908128 [Suillus clintonianus]|uniref:uncharacterized protein n=1 Tax=Suillus clintonianus TaxID=1904413 RepID=UPI001B86E82A|nr:uncharacterized protein DEU56DRAFT_908128 [Suillus clintonianus]KAG2152953.1 hypothetical protein DEU56DRAFT_908128 [Suillus clintonianus]
MSTPLSHADIVFLAQSFLRLSPTGLVTDCITCGGAVSLSICRSDKHGNGGKPMAMHRSCSFYRWYPQLLAFPHIMTLIPMSTTSPSPPNSQPISQPIASSSSTTLAMLPPSLTQPSASSSSTTLAMLPPSLTQPSSKRQRKRGERCLGSFCRRPRALHCSRNLCSRHCREAGGCHFHGFLDGLTMHGDDEDLHDKDLHDEFLTEEVEDGSFGREELRQALKASLDDFGLPIPGAPVPSMHDLLSAPPAPIPPSMPFEADSPPPPVLPMAKHPRITQQMDPIWATDLRARARQEADDKRVEERRKEMEREAKQHFVLHWFDSDDAAVRVEWVSKCPYYPQWQLADDPELVASLGTDIQKIEVYDAHLQRWIPTALTHTISLESGCHIFLRRYGVTQCDRFQELLMASKYVSRPRHLRLNMRGERDVVRTKLKAKREQAPLLDPEAEIIEIMSSPPVSKVKREREESSELALTPVRPRLTAEDFNSRYATSMSPTPSPLLFRSRSIISPSSSPPRDTISMSFSSSASSVISLTSSHHSTAPVKVRTHQRAISTKEPAITAIPVPDYDPAKLWQVWPHGMYTIDMVAGFQQMDDKRLRAMYRQHELFPLIFGVPFVKATYHHNHKVWRVTDHTVLAEHEAAGHSSSGLWSHYLDARRKALGQQSKKSQRPSKAK